MMRRSRLADADRAQDAASGFGLTAAQLEPLSRGKVSSLWRVHVRGSDFVLKRFHPKYSDAQVHASVHAQELVARRLGASPRVERTRQGDPVLHATHGRYGLFAHVPARALGPAAADALLEELAVFLARVHDALGERPIHESGFWSMPPLEPAPLDAVLAVLRARPIVDEPVISALERRRARLAAMPPSTRQRLARLTRHQVHGDVHPGNILRRSGELVLVDFDQTSMAPFVYEVMRAFVHCVRLDSNSRVFDRFERFAYAYGRARPQLANELLSMVDCYYWVQMAETRTFTDDPCNVRGLRELIRRRIALGDWLDDARTALQDAAERAVARLP